MNETFRDDIVTFCRSINHSYDGCHRLNSHDSILVLYSTFLKVNLPITSHIKRPLPFISRRAEGPGRDILQRPPSVCPSVCLSVCPSVHRSVTFSFRENAFMYFLETLQVLAPCHACVLYSF